MSGIKYDQGKPQIGLVSGIFLTGLARVLTFGVKKYSAHNWRQGIAYSRLFDALQRHLWAWWQGEEKDPESGESHLDHAACCLMFLRELSDTRKNLDDRYKEPKFCASAGYAPRESPELVKGPTSPDLLPEGSQVHKIESVQRLQGQDKVSNVQEDLRGKIPKETCPHLEAVTTEFFGRRCKDCLSPVRY